MPRPPVRDRPRRGRCFEEPTHGELMDAIEEIRERLERIEESVGRGH